MLLLLLILHNFIISYLIHILGLNGCVYPEPFLLLQGLYMKKLKPLLVLSDSHIEDIGNYHD